MNLIEKVYLKVLRTIILYIIVFSMACGITFPVISYELGRNLERKDDKPDQNNACYLDDNYISSITDSKTMIASSDIPKTKNTRY